MRKLTLITVAAILYATLHVGCVNGKVEQPDDAKVPKIMHFFDLGAQGPVLDEFASKLNAARHETTHTTLQIQVPNPGPRGSITLKLAPLELQSENAQIGVEQFKVYQVLAMPVDTNRAGYVRHTGLKVASHTLPRALLPVPIDNGKINLAGLRDPSEPLNPNSRVGLSNEPVHLWIDVNIPATARPGQYLTQLELQRDGQRVEAVPFSVHVYDFVLSEERHLHMVGRLEWKSLETLFPDIFENITPNLISRTDPRYAPAIKLLDQFVKLAQEHRTTVVVPRLQPTVKWPFNQPPQVFWEEFDSIVEPWLNGEAFADKTPLGYWPIPAIDNLNNYPPAQRLDYLRAGTSHFDGKGWMERAWFEVEKETPGRANTAESVQLSTYAADILESHPRARVTLPLEDPQLQFTNENNAKLIDPISTPRIMTAAPGLVFAPPTNAWPGGVARPARWLRTDLPGLLPYIGAGGDERDVRTWAWLAFLRQCSVIGWDGALPHSKSAQEPADPNDVTWFYPGRWFGIDEAVPTVQLKWLRRAQQDYEYLYVAAQRKKYGHVLPLIRLMTKQVQTQPNEDPDPTHGLLSGMSDAKAWNEAQDLLARQIMIRVESTPEQPAPRDEEKEAALNLAMINWIAPQDKPLQIARNTAWGWAAKAGNWVDLSLGIDIYNASDQPMTGDLQWVAAPRGWEFNPQPKEIAPNNSVNVFQVKQFDMEARVNLDTLSADARKPIQLKFVDALRKRPSYLTVLAPVARSDRREGQLLIDGNLGDWDDGADAIHLGPLAMMLDRPTLQKQTVQFATTPSSVYSNWAAKSLYVAFKLEGVSGDAARVEKNFVDMQLRRAWGEDLCEIVVQPIYANVGDVGQIVHIVCKPRGQMVIFTKHSPKNQKLFGTAYKDVVGAEVRFASAVDSGTWRGEVAIPWDLINDKDHKGLRPTLVRFNFVQHKGASGESASWAGPLDYGRDDSFMGLLYLRNAPVPGMKDAGRE